jgi:hypothetical protein
MKYNSSSTPRGVETYKYEEEDRDQWRKLKTVIGKRDRSELP